jgi:mRNA-degrading endonuclease toxin of MazEF toxin-antitoxin module
VTRGKIYRTPQPVAERGDKPGYYVVVSRNFIGENTDISTVICAPVYRRVLGIRSEVEIGTGEGLPHRSAIRCDFLMLMFKSKLTVYVGALPAQKMQELDHALKYALSLS